MFDRYYQQQLSLLRQRAAEFAQAHPAIAPLLASTSTDPDVERLLEGTAFLCGTLQQKIDDDFPELVQGLTDIVFPHVLRPAPSASIAVFTPHEALLDFVTVAKGTELASVPVDGTKCIFRTAMETTIAPVRVTGVQQRKVDNSEIITVALQIRGMRLTDWKPDRLTFFPAGEFSEAAHLFMRLCSGIKAINLRAGSRTCAIYKKFLTAPGLDPEVSLFTLPEQSFRGYALLSEYFVIPEKFLFFELGGLSALRDMGETERFEIDFVVAATRDPIPVRAEHFTLFAVPIVNLFHCDAEPVQVDHARVLVPVIPAGYRDAHVYSIDSVTGLVQGSVERKNYTAFNETWRTAGNQASVYQVHRTISPVDNRYQVGISLNYGEVSNLARETLSIDVTCTNGHRAQKLRAGDICVATSSSPELASFTNVIAPTPQIDVQLAHNDLWRLLSALSMNLLSLGDAAALKELLRLYTYEQQRSDSRSVANVKRVESIASFQARQIDRLHGGAVMRGLSLSMAVDESHFAGLGDLYLFCSVVDRFLALYASINTFTQLEVLNARTGEVLRWKPRIGRKPLL